MVEIILSVNAGSSSVKVSVYKSTYSSQKTDPIQIAEGSISGLTSPSPRLKYTRGDHVIKGQEVQNIDSHEDAFKFILEHFTVDDGLSELEKSEDIRFVCHRVVHGGDYTKSQVVDKEAYHYIEQLSDLAPLHNTQSLAIIRASSKLLPSAKMITFFDSSFHSTMPPHIYTYPIDQTVARKNNLRKYGFHGISYAFIVHEVSQFLKKPQSQLNIVALHLGSGASACCIEKGRSVDTSMGLTPLAGLPGATRSGSIDPSLIFQFTHNAGKLSRSLSREMHITEAEDILNTSSGWKALTGTTDFGRISTSGRAEDQLAFHIFVDRILNYVPSYFAKLGGEVDALVFAGGIGENGERLRKAVVDGVRCLGFAVDDEKNGGPSNEIVTDISGREAKHKTLICRTDEQLQMARGVHGI